MAQIEREVKITYRWWNDDRSEIKPNHIEALEESAMERITKMMGEGYTAGELNDNIRMDDDDPDDGIPYKGWWEINTKCL